jgi:hypothetical protein
MLDRRRDVDSLPLKGNGDAVDNRAFSGEIWEIRYGTAR